MRAMHDARPSVHTPRVDFMSQVLPPAASQRGLRAAEVPPAASRRARQLRPGTRCPQASGSDTAPCVHRRGPASLDNVPCCGVDVCHSAFTSNHFPVDHRAKQRPPCCHAELRSTPPGGYSSSSKLFFRCFSTDFFLRRVCVCVRNVRAEGGGGPGGVDNCVDNYQPRRAAG